MIIFSINIIYRFCIKFVYYAPDSNRFVPKKTRFREKDEDYIEFDL
ncbi:hypothetical protein PP176A_1105 [Sporanaerobacter sp. PP17-6a]|nr:hypothetical protein PP176A_1105 [Sporanaerobacter sp. PP17-6a]